MLAYKTFVSALTVAIGAGFASAQSVSLSSTCLDSMKGLLTSPDSQCLNAASLLQLAINSQDIPGTINNWLTGLCSSGSCSDDAIQRMVANVTGGCSQDLSNVGVSVDGNLQSSITSIVQKAYPTVRKVICLKDTSKNQLCPVEMLNNLQSIVGQLGIDDLSYFNLLADVKTLLTSDKTKSDLACTSCVKSAYSTVRADFPDLMASSDVTNPLTDVCGVDFISGGQGDNINQTAVTGQFVAQAPNSASVPFANAGLGLVALAAAFAFLG